MGKKKKGNRKAQPDLEEAKEEMLTLKAIYGDDLMEHPNSLGFNLSVLPHPGDAAANFVTVDLDIRYPDGYPSSELSLRVHNAQGLSVAESRALSKGLHRLAAQHASASEVCAFNLVVACQEFLQEHNKTPTEEDPPPGSLWHAMQLRDAPEQTAPAAETLVEGNSPRAVISRGLGDLGFSSLFQEDDEDTRWQLNVPSPAPKPDPVGGVLLARLSLAEAGEDARGSYREARERGRDEEAGMEGYPAVEMSSSSMMGSMFSRARQAIGAAISKLPPAIRKLLEGPAQSEDDDVRDAISEASETVADSKEMLRRDLLMGHLLRLATQGSKSGGGSLPAHALPELTSQLAAEGLIPKWIQWTLTQHPDLFDRAYKRLFKDELRAAQEGSPQALADPHSRWAISSFWRPPTNLFPQQPIPQAPKDTQSRYLSDFQEVRVLGRGAYGLAVAAVNRLDGRQYAVKQIRLQREVPGAFSRIMREVATLSRLQHPNVVRYFQAWTESAPGEGAAGVQGDSELENWLGESSSKQAVSTAQETKSRSLVAPRIAGLDSLDLRQSKDNKLGQLPEEDTDDSSQGLWQACRPSDEQTDGTKGGDESQSRLRPQTAKAVGQQHEEGAAQEADQMLFIQMEFCPRTLTQVLAQGPIEDVDAWQVVRQILAGLAHIHAQGVIHRDLKPDNIFFDAKAVLKLGDFGLAKFSRALGAAQHAHEEDTDDDADDKDDHADSHRPLQQLSSMQSEVTGRVGTSFYMSPEVANGWARYDAKVDLYSLGVVAFELWHPFATGMERIKLLTELRDKGLMPAAWETEHPPVARLIRWLMAANPAERPSARDVLHSSMLPPDMGDEELAGLLRTLPDDAETLDKVLDTVFSMPSNDASAASDELPGTPVDGQVAEHEALIKLMKGTFAVHGAVPMASSAIGFRPPDVALDAACLLDRSGAILALRHELRAPFAAWLAGHAGERARSGGMLEAMRRYEVAWVRRKAPGRALPRSHLQADLDFVSSSSSVKTASEAALCEAEVLKAVVEVLEQLPEVPLYEIRLGHRAVLEAVLHYIGIAQDVAKSVMGMLSEVAHVSPRFPAARTKHWASVKVALQGLGVPPDAIARCKQVVLQVPGESEAALHKLRAKLEAPGDARQVAASGRAALDTLAAIAAHLHTWGLLPSQVVVDPLLWQYAEYYTGSLLQVHILHHDNSGNSSVVASGGRYDGLLRSLWPPAALALGPALSAVGVTFNVDRLLPYLGSQLSRHSASSQADVLVCGRGGGGLLKERMALAAQLWAAGVRAQLLHLASPSLTAHYEFANAHSITWLAIIQRATFSATDTVKVRNLERRTEEEIPFGDVSRFLAASLQGNTAPSFGRSSSMTHAHATLRAVSGDDDLAADDANGDEDLKILNPRRRDRKDRDRK